jgi:signal transduction histidine kinase/ActR/RegA family two-component response regulator
MYAGAIVFVSVFLLVLSNTGIAWLIRKLRQSRLHSKNIISAKNAALSILSHEIRNPLSGLQSVVRLLRMTTLDDNQRKLVETLDNTSCALLSLLNQNLERSQPEKLKTENAQPDSTQPEFSLHILIDEIVAALEPQAQEKGLLLTAKMDCSLPQQLCGDTIKIRQILFNLLCNAIKFTHSGIVKLHVIQLHLVNKQQTGNAINLSFHVIDSGAGIPAEAIEKLFTPYFQIAKNEHTGGNGLGLSISRDLARSMGGDITVESQEGRGSVFMFSLPCTVARRERGLSVVASSVATIPAEALPVTVAPLRLLVVDDSDIHRIAAHALLELAGHRVSVVASASEAIRALEWQSFDCVLMDIQMPEMDGLSAIRMIRSMPLASKKPPGIVLVSAWAEPEDITQWLECGADAACGKPLDPLVINQILAAICPARVIHESKSTAPNPESPLSPRHNCRIC